MSDNGKRCSGCGRVRDRSKFSKSTYHRGGLQNQCRDCANKARRPPAEGIAIKQAPAPVWLEHPPGELRFVPGGLPHSEDSLRYACMDAGWRMKPTGGRTKREVFCRECTAGACVLGGLVIDIQAGIIRSHN